MSQPNPDFDTIHPSGHILFRSCRGGYMHSAALTESAMATDADALAQGILLAANVSYLKAVMEVRGEIVGAGYTPSGDVPTQDDLNNAMEALQEHHLPDRTGE